VSDIVSTSNYQNNSTSSTQIVDLPSSLVSGNLLFLLLRVAESRTITNDFVSDGWTIIGEREVSGGFYVLAKIIDGSEGSAYEVTIGGGQSRITTIGVQLSGHGGLDDIALVIADADTLDPPEVTASWGASPENRFFAILSLEKTNRTTTTYPDNYDGLIVSANASNTAGTHTRTELLTRVLDASSDNPTTFELSGSHLGEKYAATLVFGPPDASPVGKTKISGQIKINGTIIIR
jgi:hypothetical protein